MDGPRLYLDLAEPECYLAAERALQTMPVATPWVPVLARELDEHERRGPALDREEFAARAARAGLQPVRWPDPFPFDGERVALAATYARSIGRVVPFALAAFRQAFAGGHALDGDDSIAVAGAACEMHPRALLRGAAARTTRDALSRETDAARAAGVRRLPAVLLADGRVFEGPDCLDDAASALRSAA